MTKLRLILYTTLLVVTALAIWRHAHPPQSQPLHFWVPEYHSDDTWSIAKKEWPVHFDSASECEKKLAHGGTCIIDPMVCWSDDNPCLELMRKKGRK